MASRRTRWPGCRRCLRPASRAAGWSAFTRSARWSRTARRCMERAADLLADRHRAVDQGGARPRRRSSAVNAVRTSHTAQRVIAYSIRQASRSWRLTRKGAPALATLLVHHAIFASHQTSAGHPERPDRYRTVQAALGRPQFDALMRDEAELARPRHDALRPHQRLRRRAGGGPPARGLRLSRRRRHDDGSHDVGGRAARRGRHHAGRRQRARRAPCRTPSSRAARPATTPKPIVRWASACSTTSASARVTRS